VPPNGRQVADGPACPGWRQTLLLQLIDEPANARRRIAVRLAAGDLISDDTVAIDVERRRRVVESHHLLRVRGIHAGNRERKLRLVQIALQPLRVLIDADQQERDARVVLVFRVGRLQVR
jgi:hypothetical protein